MYNSSFLTDNTALYTSIWRRPAEKKKKEKKRNPNSYKADSF